LIRLAEGNVPGEGNMPGKDNVSTENRLPIETKVLPAGTVPLAGNTPPDHSFPKKAGLARADEVARPITDPNRWRQQPHRHPRNVRIMPKSRDFH
jgi:hypothetical protein